MRVVDKRLPMPAYCVATNCNYSQMTPGITMHELPRNRPAVRLKLIRLYPCGSLRQSISLVFGARVGHFAATPQSDVVGVWSRDLGVMATPSARQKVPFIRAFITLRSQFHLHHRFQRALTEIVSKITPNLGLVLITPNLGLVLNFGLVLRTSPRFGVIFDTISVKTRWERWYTWNCDLGVINARGKKKREKKSILCRIEWVAETHRKKYTCAYYVRHSEEFSSLINGQLEIRRRRREGQRDLNTAVTVRTHQAELCWKTTRTSCQQPRCQNWQYELVSAHISHTLPFVVLSFSSILNVS